MKKLILFVAVMACVITFGQKKEESYLRKVGELKFEYTDFFISRPGKITKLNNYIFAVDRGEKTVHIFNENLTHIKSFGRKGEGPGEFISVSSIDFNRGKYYVYDNELMRISIYDEEFNYVEHRKYPAGYMYSFAPFRAGDYTFFPAYRRVGNSPKEFFKIGKSFIAVDEYGGVSELLSWEENYLKFTAYTMLNPYSFLLKGNNNIYARQIAGDFLYEFDVDLNQTKKFGVIPRFYKTPPEFGIKEYMSDPSKEEELVYNTTWIENGCYDTKKELLIIEYKNLTKNGNKDKDTFVYNYYMQVYDKNYNLVYDNTISGRICFAEDGILYILENEKMDELVLSKFEIIK